MFATQTKYVEHSVAGLGVRSARTATMRAHAQTFFFAARFLPAPARDAVITLYAFCRAMDDLVDDAQTPEQRADARQHLHAWRAWLISGARSTALPADLALPLSEVLHEYGVPVQYLLELLDGLEADLTGVQIKNFRDLRLYCYQVASTVGLCMAHLLGARTPRALAAAEELGIAMQLTNILRDVGTDLTLGRIYLPSQELATFGLDAERLRALVARGRGPDRRFRALMQFQVARAYHQYERGLEGVPLLPRDVQLAILLASRLYRGILDVIEARRYDVLRQRASTSPLTKCREAVACGVTVKLWDLLDLLQGHRSGNQPNGSSL